MSPAARQRPWTLRFRLRTLLIGAAVVAGVLAAPAWYDYLYRAQITPLTDAEAQQLRLFGPTPIRELTPADGPSAGERFLVEYRPRYANASRLNAAAETDLSLMNYHASYENSRALIKAEQAETAERFLELFRSADTPSPNTWVMRGVVVDAGGRPLGRVLVDLVGQYNQINGCLTRADGTFVHAVDIAGGPPARRYRSRFRLRGFGGGWRYYTRSFTVAAGESMQVRLRLPVATPAPDAKPSTGL